jgi:hypothetical protein
MANSFGVLLAAPVWAPTADQPRCNRQQML